MCGSTNFEFMVSKLFGMITSLEISLKLSAAIRQEFNKHSNSHKKVANNSSLSCGFSFNIELNIVITDHIIHSQAPPMWLLYSGFYIHVIQSNPISVLLQEDSTYSFMILFSKCSQKFIFYCNKIGALV